MFLWRRNGDLRGTSRVAKRESSLLSSCEEELGISPESLNGNRASSQIQVGSGGLSRVVSGNSGFLLNYDGGLGNLLSCKMEVKPPFMLQEGTRDFFRVTAVKSRLILG